MTYRVLKEKEEYAIVEKDTDLVVQRLKDQAEARDLCRSLNLGSGFNGFTPAFFVEDFKQKERPPIE